MFYEKIKRAFQRFCEKTSCHGFIEIYHSKSLFWKIFWAIICIAAAGITTYQVYQSVDQYIYQSSNTVILSADEYEIIYPELGLCYWHWVYWVDWKKAKTLNYSREALLFGLTYFNTIFTTADIDVDNAHDSLLQQMKRNNHSTVFEFFNAVARDVPIWDQNNLKSYFDKTNIIFQDPNVFFCYQVSSPNMFQYFAQNANPSGQNYIKTMSFMTFDDTFDDLNGIVNLDEFKYYMKRWIEQKANYTISPNTSTESLKQFVVPIMLFLNGYMHAGVQISAENFAYYIHMKAMAFTWQNKSSNPCVKSLRISSTNNSCELKCESKSYQKHCTCQYLDHAISINDDQPDKVCRKTIEHLSADLTETTLNSTDLGNFWSKRVCDNDTNQLREKCRNECEIPCQIWKYETSVSVTTMPTIVRNIGTKRQTNVYIEYPSGKDIVVMIETDNQSWENFIGSVGGLLGIWTGASLLSFIELFYLCCFADNECGDAYFANRKGKRKARIASIMADNVLTEVK